jgi:uncharacterized protein with FMN-binding domain
MIQIPRRAASVLVGTSVVTVLLFTFKTPGEFLGGAGVSPIAVIEDGGTGATSPPPAATAAPGTTATPKATAAPDTGSTGSAVTEVAGPTVSTRFGPVQVQIEVSGGTVTDVVALQLPSGGRSGRISDYAEPTLHDEALSAQSASIDGVSGATYTSRAYAKSLQAALDQAGI